MSQPNQPKGFGSRLLDFAKGGNAVLRIVILIAIVALIAFGIGRLQNRDKGRSKVSRTISQTITEIKKINEFCTANYSEETIVTARRKRRIGQDEIAIVVKGTVRAGFDLHDMTTTIQSDTSIVVVLPKPKVLDVITNPSDCETFVETGRWTHRQVTQYKDIARQRILKHAQDDGILKDAEQHGCDRLRHIFLGMGFKNVTIVVDGN